VKRMVLFTACAALLLSFASTVHATDWWNAGDSPYGDGMYCRRFPSIEQTIKDCETLLKTGHHFRAEKVPHVLEELSWYYEDLKQYAAAALLLQKAMQMDPADAEFYAGDTGLDYGRQGRYAYAISYLDGQIARQGKKWALVAARCWNRAAFGQQLDLALEDCNAAIDMKTGYTYPIRTRCLVYIRMGNYRSAIKDCDGALAEFPRDEGALFMRGVAKLNSSDIAGGNADISAAKAIRPDVAEDYATYGVTP
jgi:tetratricopeptide (TPR) repeat protein